MQPPPSQLALCPRPATRAPELEPRQIAGPPPETPCRSVAAQAAAERLRARVEYAEAARDRAEAEAVQVKAELRALQRELSHASASAKASARAAVGAVADRARAEIALARQQRLAQSGRDPAAGAGAEGAGGAENAGDAEDVEGGADAAPAAQGAPVAALSMLAAAAAPLRAALGAAAGLFPRGTKRLLDGRPAPGAGPAPRPAAWAHLPTLPPKRPEDNGTLSDDSDSVGSSPGRGRRSRSRKGKPAPRWCSSYLEDLEAQEGLDPDSVFGVGVPRCELDDVFPQALYRAAGLGAGGAWKRRRRGSSGNWRRDGLARAEVQEYKRRCNHARPWAPAPEAPAPGDPAPAAALAPAAAGGGA